MLKSRKWRIGLGLYFLAMNAILLFFIYSISGMDRALAVSYEVGAYEYLKVWAVHVLVGNVYIFLPAIILAAILFLTGHVAKLLNRLSKSLTARQSSTTETGKR